MRDFFRSFRAELLKLRGTSVLPLHLIIPPVIAAVFLLYYAYAPWSSNGKLAAYFQVLAAGFPALISLFCAALAETEAESGFQNLLSAPRRLPIFYGKATLLILLGAFSILLASLIFGAGNVYILHQSPVGLSFYLLAGFILIGCSVILYIFHLFLAFRFSRGVSVLTGLAEALLSALMLTGLGDRSWRFLPCAWAARLITHILSTSFDSACGTAVILCIVCTIGAAALFTLWVKRWEGPHISE